MDGYRLPLEIASIMCVSRCVPVLCSREELLTEIMILSLQLLQEFLFLGESFFCECEEKKHILNVQNTLKVMISVLCI